ncbi:MAG: TetR/AcrR family transcriptional regulator [Cyanobacteria bacterium J06560_2]
MEETSFADLSITDICKQADIARVTFYQHYESKEALLLASVADFFASFQKAINQEQVDLYLEKGDAAALGSTQHLNLADPSRVRLIGVALQYVGTDVRQMMIASFFHTYSQRETELNEKEMQVLATFYIGGMLALMEQFFKGQLTVSQQEFQMATLQLLRVLRRGVIEADILYNPPSP